MQNIKIKLFSGDEELECIKLVDSYHGSFNKELLRAMIEGTFGTFMQKLDEEARQFEI